MQTPIQHTHRKKKKGGRKEEKKKRKGKKEKTWCKRESTYFGPGPHKKNIRPTQPRTLYYDVINFSLSTKFFNYFYFIFVIRKLKQKETKYLRKRCMCLISSNVFLLSLCLLCLLCPLFLLKICMPQLCKKKYIKSYSSIFASSLNATFKKKM